MQTKEEKREYQRRWCAANRKHVTARNKAWEERNREKKLKSAKASYHKHKHKNRERRLANASAWYYKNKERVLIQKKELYRTLVTELRITLFEHYGKKCQCCDADDVRFLTLDHVNHGKGNPAPNIDRHMIQFYRRIIAEGFPSDYQILCIGCNWAKGMWGKCFHEVDREAIFDNVS